MSEINTSQDIDKGEACFGYRAYNGGACSVLRESISEAYRFLNFCNTIECPFYKPRSIAYKEARLGNEFVPYTREQIRIADSFKKVTRSIAKI